MLTNDNNTPVSVLVTGGAGFIGSNFVHYMLKEHPDYTVINLDSLTYAGNLENLKDVKGNVKYSFIKGDICDQALINSIFEKYNPLYVVNFAAESHVDRSILNPQVFLQTNIAGTQVLLDACKRHWKIDGGYLPEAKFVQVSTDEVYGSLGQTGYFTERTPLSPNSPYSASKASADMFVRAYHETYGLNVNITRCSNNYGPYQFPEKLIPLMISNALEDKELPVYGDGMNVRDWLYVEDHCKAIDVVIHKGKSGEVYNVGGHNEKANIEIVKIILEELGKPESLIKYVDDRLGHDRRYAIDPQKIKDELGWEPTIMFDEGIRLTIHWYLNNKEWLEHIKNGEYKNYNKRCSGE
ncbi:MAG: dTDP-glucose 4,6-dehydratase [Paenibacillus macerans]|uniref:dTDP-glucose 4,6-dehydratase n=1 Tax=Paenibacillus macerans TaxID=44252 RepID=UPI001B209941|nr:dTDP-glucose 4,6-dehydratase [Paenibacillus macerans]MDU7473083.1 dTDP-glucose 4,6-dehydratase [Paenibacillus macerans]GIP08703.1 dTDP-glucose 4,6-dehydratase [Paenibacillus macerans]